MRGGALLAELRLRAILVLAPGTSHTERLPIPDSSGQPGSRVTAPGPPPELGVPAVPWGTAPRPYRDPASGARWAVLGRGSPWSLWGDPIRRLRRVRTHVYATLLTATRHPGVLTQPRWRPQGNRVADVRCSALRSLAAGTWGLSTTTSPRCPRGAPKIDPPHRKKFWGTRGGSQTPGVRGRGRAGACVRSARVPPLPRRSAARPPPAGAEPGRGVTGLAAAPRGGP